MMDGGWWMGWDGNRSERGALRRKDVLMDICGGKMGNMALKVDPLYFLLHNTMC